MRGERAAAMCLCLCLRKNRRMCEHWALLFIAFVVAIVFVFVYGVVVGVDGGGAVIRILVSASGDSQNCEMRMKTEKSCSSLISAICSFGFEWNFIFTASLLPFMYYILFGRCIDEISMCGWIAHVVRLRAQCRLGLPTPLNQIFHQIFTSQLCVISVFALIMWLLARIIIFRLVLHSNSGSTLTHSRSVSATCASKHILWRPLCSLSLATCDEFVCSSSSMTTATIYDLSWFSTTQFSAQLWMSLKKLYEKAFSSTNVCVSWWAKSNGVQHTVVSVHITAKAMKKVVCILENICM